VRRTPQGPPISGSAPGTHTHSYTGTAKSFSTLPGDAKARNNALPYQIAFKLCDRSHNGKQRLPQRAAGVDVFLIADELDAERTELLKRQQQVFRASGESIKTPDDNRIELPLSCIGHQFIQLWPGIFCP